MLGGQILVSFWLSGPVAQAMRVVVGRALRFCVEQLFPLMKHKIGVLPILPGGIVIKAVFSFHSHVLKF